MKRAIPILLCAVLSPASHAQCNACQDSVSIWESMQAQTQENNFGPLNKDFAFNTSPTPYTGPMCSAPHYDGNGHCVATCSDGTVISSDTGQTFCAGERP